MTSGLLIGAQTPRHMGKTLYYAGEIISTEKWGQCFYVAASFDWINGAKQYSESHNFDLIKVDYENYICRRVYIYDKTVCQFRQSNTVFSFYNALV